jgi:hypothetical protein
MATMTYGSHARVHGATVEKKSAQKTSASKAGFFSRLWTAMMEARMRQAMTELRLHSHLLPAEFELAGNKISYKNEDQLPFIRSCD